MEQNQQEEKKNKQQNNTTYKRFIVDGANKKVLKQQKEPLKIKKIRKSRRKKENFLITLKNSKRINDVKKKVQAKGVINAIKKGSNKNFSEGDYSDHSDSYIDMDQAHQIQRKLLELQQQREQDQLNYQKKLLELKQEQELNSLGVTQSFQKLQEQVKEQQGEIRELQEKILQYESHQFSDALQGLTGFKNLLYNERQIQLKAQLFAQRLKNQMYTETQLLKECSQSKTSIQDQVLAQVVSALLTTTAKTPQK